MSGFTKFTKPVIIDVADESGAVIFNGVDFTQDALVTIENAKKVAFRNCRIYALNIDGEKNHFITTAKGLNVQVSFTGCYTGTIVDGEEVFSLIDTNAVLVSGSSFSKNYMDENSFSSHFIDLRKIASGAKISISENIFETNENGVTISLDGDTTCDIIVNGNLTVRQDPDDKDNATVCVRPNKRETTSFEHVNIEMNQNQSPDSRPIVATYTDEDTVLTRKNIPNVMVDGVPYDMDIIPPTVADPVAMIGEYGYKTLQDALDSAKNGDTITIMKDDATNITILPGTELTFAGKSKDIVYTGKFVCNAIGTKNTKVTIRDLTFDGKGSGEFGIISQNQTDNDQMELTLHLYGVVIENFTKKAIYLTNAKSFHMSGCTIQDCATAEMDDPNTQGDYAIDFNLVAVKDSKISIVNNYFKGGLGKKSAVKLAQRGGASDKGASDIPKNVGEASVSRLIFTGNQYTGTTEIALTIGTTSKTPGEPELANTSGAYKALVQVDPVDPLIKVKSAYMAEPLVLEVPSGKTAQKEPSGDIAIVEDIVNA